MILSLSFLPCPSQLRAMDLQLDAWTLPPAEVTFHAERENKIYRVAAGAQTYALRLHRPGLRTPAHIEAELTWMESLAAEGLPVPRPVRIASGALVCDAGAHLRTLITWLPGRPLGHRQDPLRLPDPVGTFTAMGALLAQLHSLPAAQNLDRPRWDAQGLLGPAPLWGKFWEHPDLTMPERHMLLTFQDQALNQLAQWALPVQLIHADFLQENVLVDGSNVYAIDFDDSAYGFTAFDLATPLVQRLPDPRFPALRDALLAGYGSAGQDSRLREQLALMFAIRCLTYVGWIQDKMDGEDARAMSGRIVTRALAQCRAWLGGHSPILA